MAGVEDEIEWRGGDESARQRLERGVDADPLGLALWRQDAGGVGMVDDLIKVRNERTSV